MVLDMFDYCTDILLELLHYSNQKCLRKCACSVAQWGYIINILTVKFNKFVAYSMLVEVGFYLN